ncbi:hypothetical protein P691DRAFT_728553 [Macrolepiota fuliginosa MF-IS2]|uniref:DUF7598 domain-containing protein n=1 Tax=Macrolepiota fuliginosa MF-IS2 TaxID=1400762 RepID=A0A9P6C568_9AGAR|nr:hypothetical protein P691DRAFT_728553 [Macrolepiota fuliginosa MF-IS2]
MLPPRAYVFLGLNAVRTLSIIALLLVFSSNIVTLVNDVKAVNRFEAAGGNGTATNSTLGINGSELAYISGSTVPNQPAGAFWAVLNRLLIIGQVLVLILSEFGFPARFFNRFFPVLGKDFGLGALGVIQMLLGAAILSHHVDTFTLVSAFFLFSIGCLNVLLGLIFREGAKSKRSITSWRDQAKNVLPTPVQQGLGAAKTVSSHLGLWTNTNEMDEKKKLGHIFGDSLSNKPSVGSNNGPHSGGLKRDFSGMGFGRQGEKAAGLKGFLIAKPVESLPRYAPSMGARATPTGESDGTMV